MSATSAGNPDSSFWSKRLTNTRPAIVTPRGLRERPHPSSVFRSDDVRSRQRLDEAFRRVRRLAGAESRRGVDDRLSRGQPTIARDDRDRRRTGCTRRGAPVISPGPLVPIADFGPVDRRRVGGHCDRHAAGGADPVHATGPHRFGAPASSTRSITRPRRGRCCTTTGVEDNPGYGLVVHPPLGS